MKEDFNRTIVFDFSKMSEGDIRKAQEIVANLFPSLRNIDLSMYCKKELTPEDVLEIMSKTIVHPTGKNLSIGAWKGFMKIMNYYHPGIVFSLILRTIAVEMDKQYAGHISECPNVYIHDNLNGRIECINSAAVTKNAWKYFAAFRSQEEAIAAVKLTQAVRHAVCEQED